MKELTDSRYSVYDVLPTFFEHDDPWIVLAALEVYVRRAYKAYTLLSVDYEEGDGLDDGEAPHAVTWRFKLGQSYIAPTTPTLYAHFVQFSRLIELIFPQQQASTTPGIS